jgi:hypothetical protein
MTFENTITEKEFDEILELLFERQNIRFRRMIESGQMEFEMVVSIWKNNILK